MYVYMYILVFNFCCICKLFVKCFIHIHCRRLCKTTEIFVKKKHVFFYLIFIPTHLGFGL